MTTPSRGTTLLWAVGLSTATAFVVGSVVRTPPGLSPMAFTGLLAVVSLPTLAGLLWRRYEEWNRLGPDIGFVVYFLSLFVGVVVLAGTAGTLVAGAGLLVTVTQLLASAVAFAVTAWLCFDGGAQAVAMWAGPRLGLEI